MNIETVWSNIKLCEGEVFYKNISLEKVDFENDISVGYLPASIPFLEKKTVKQNIEYVLKIRDKKDPYAYVKVNNALVGYGLDYINFIPLCDEIGLDWSRDTYDEGMHLNVYGAEKLTRYFGKILSEKYGIADRRSDSELTSAWQEKISVYYERKNSCKQ